MTADAPQLAMVAGEASGDLLASLLLGGVRMRWPQARTFGIGGPKMASEGFDAWWPSDKLAVRGYVEVLRHYREIAGIRRALARAPAAATARSVHRRRRARLQSRAWRSACAMPGCARCSSSARRSGPGVPGACRPSRARSTMCCACFRSSPRSCSVPASRPPSSAIRWPMRFRCEPPRAASRAALGLADGDVVVAVLPGSRRSEIQANGPAFLQAADRMHAQRPDLRFVLPVAPGLRSLVEPLVAQWARRAPIALLDGQSHEALAACDVTLIASGTATWRRRCSSGRW